MKPPIARICGYHPMERVTWIPPSKVRSPRRWVQRDILLCLHCASTVESTDTRVTGCEVGAPVLFLILLRILGYLIEFIPRSTLSLSRLHLHPIIGPTIAVLT